jgi:hypothetical protein
MKLEDAVHQITAPKLLMGNIRKVEKFLFHPYPFKKFG